MKFNKVFKNIFLGLIVLGMIYLILKIFRPFGFGSWQAYELFQNNVMPYLNSHVFWPIQFFLHKTLLTPYIYMALALTMFLECLIPANPKQKVFSISFFQDFIWFFYEALSDVFINFVYFDAVRWVYNAYFSFLTVQSVGQWPYWTRFVLGVLLLDFLYWLQHYINHKVPWLWELHTVHHSQKEINFFTDFRYHAFEYVVRKTILIIPFLIFTINTPDVVIFSLVTTWYTRFYHGNVRTNLGPLRYLLVTPQSHRLHHSRLLQHRDLNFGALFCIWDRIFKTQYHGDTEYPETGIDDAAFPLENDFQPLRALFMPIKQMSYSVKRFGSRFRAWILNKKDIQGYE